MKLGCDQKIKIIMFKIIAAIINHRRVSNKLTKRNFVIENLNAFNFSTYLNDYSNC